VGKRGDRRLPERDLSPRARPVQKRAQDTLDLILDTAGAILDEGGIDAFNTNRLAERAGVAIRTVYRYYPNKLAVIVGFAERQAEQWQESFGGLIAAMRDPKESALDVWGRILDAYVAFLEGKRGRAAIRRAMQALPQLCEVNRRDNDILSREIALALKERGVRRPLAQLHVVGRLLLETSDAAVDDALDREGRVPTSVLDEIKLMHRSYLARYDD
jgi:AcrR family transcriptional regulator